MDNSFLTLFYCILKHLTSVRLRTIIQLFVVINIIIINTKYHVKNKTKLNRDVVLMNDKIKNQLEILKQKEKELSTLYRHIAIKFGISDNEFRIMYALMVSDDEYTQQSISGMLSLPKQTVNSVITNLTKKGYVHLETIPGTRNRKIIRLTDAGKEYGKNNVLHTYEAEQRAIAKMSDIEVQTYVEILGKYIYLLQEEFTGKLLCET